MSGVIWVIETGEYSDHRIHAAYTDEGAAISASGAL